MNELNLALANVINNIVENWPLLVLILIGWRFKSFNLIAVAASVMISVILLSRFSFWFSVFVWMILWGIELYEKSFTESRKEDTDKNDKV